MHPGGEAPWGHLDAEERWVDAERLRRAFDDLGPAVATPHEQTASRASAVLAPFYEHEGELHVVLTRRSAALRVHSGEVSFPGGGRDPGEDLVDTALREAWEEVQLDPSTVEIIGELDHLGTFVSDSYIIPYVGLLPGRPDLRANPAEVEAILHVRVAELLDPANFREERWPLFGDHRPIWFFELVGDTVWGATAAMLRQVLGLSTGTLTRGGLGL